MASSTDTTRTVSFAPVASLSGHYGPSLCPGIPSGEVSSPSIVEATKCERARRLSERLTDRHRLPGELTYRSTAIYNQCRHCRGWEGDRRGLAAAVDHCPNQSCALWPMRSTRARKGRHLPPGVDRASAVRQFCNGCQCIPVGARRDAVRDYSTVECWLHPWRNGPLDEEA